MAYILQKQSDKAIARVKLQIERQPKSSASHVLLASLLFDAKDLSGAQANAQQALQLDSNNFQAVALLTRILLTRGATDQAISVMQQWVKSKPDDAAAYVTLGTMENARHDTQDAQKYYEKALQLQPDQPVAANNLAYIMLATGQNTDVALGLAQTARRAMPNSPNAADTLGWAYYLKGTYGSARDSLEQAAKGDANNASIQLHLGLVYQKLSDRKTAATHLNRAISLAPNSPTADAARKALAQTT